MMVDIFSSFDPATASIFNFSPSLFWAMNIITIALIHPMFWAAPSQTTWALSLPVMLMYEQSTRTATKDLKGLTSLLVSLYLLMTLTNFMGVIPYVFSVSSHLFFTLSFGLPIWIGLIISSMKFSTTTTLASLLPSGAPAWLNPFLILIETVSTIVRPITLSFRLAANMSAGHIVLTLMGVYLSFTFLCLNWVPTIFLFLIQAGYTAFELGICIIQAYIFCLLLSL
uniref:ATP synthase subunit a n=1 Tax=Aurospio banyulensis TaxID=3050091 RepID=A0AAU6QGW9_9ANNE